MGWMVGVKNRAHPLRYQMLVGGFVCMFFMQISLACQPSFPAKRIISLAPNITELLFAAGAGDRIVGVSRYSDYPFAARAIPVVGDYNSVNCEIIFVKQPDLIVALKGAPYTFQIISMSIPVYWVDIRTLADIPRTLRDLGCLTGTEKIANQEASRFEEQYEDLKKHYAKTKPIKIFFELNEHPLMTVTHSTVIDEVIRLCGGRNIFSDLSGFSPEVTFEEVMVRNPDVIVSVTENKDWVEFWRAWPELYATKRNAFITLTPDWMERAGPRILLGAEELCLQVSDTGRVICYPS